MCECGCGSPAPIAAKSSTAYGHVRGQPMRFVLGHQARGRKFGPPSEETREKIRTALVGRNEWWTPERRAAQAERVRALGRTGASSGSWKGGTTIFASGYRGVYLPDHPRAYSNGYVYEHIVVAEQAIGRPVVKGEQVHHLDHDRLNNDPANLVVVASGSEHMRLYHSQGRPRQRALKVNPESS